MWIDNPIYKKDLEEIINSDIIDIKSFDQTSVLITGATGLLGSMLVNTFMYANQKLNFNIKVCAVVRDLDKAGRMFVHLNGDNEHFSILCCDISDKDDLKLKLDDITFDYVIHTASPTMGSFFTEHPVETVNFGYMSTANLLEYCILHRPKGFLYLSSMEAYGANKTTDKLSEDSSCTIDTTNIRNTYPELKRMCEILCASYAAEYEVNAMSVRLAQTFGAGISDAENRVFAYIARCVMNDMDVVLKTKGDSAHPYLYTTDAVIALLTVLLKGTKGMVYNAANEKTYCSIYDMAVMVCEKFSKSSKVLIENSDSSAYPPSNYLMLDTTRIQKLGFTAKIDLRTMYERLIGSLRNTGKE